MSKLTLRHYSDKPVTSVSSERQRDFEDLSSYSKPQGFWVSAVGEDDWESWCRSEQFRDVDRQLAYDIILAPDANIITLSSHGELIEFQRQFGRDSRAFFHGLTIDWGNVAEAYSGIIIAPYIWSARMELSWYYGWDCASGCIWDGAAVESLAPVRKAAAIEAGGGAS